MILSLYDRLFVKTIRVNNNQIAATRFGKQLWVIKKKTQIFVFIINLSGGIFLSLTITFFRGI